MDPTTYELGLLLTDVILHSWHEMGVYDLPAVIDYILHYTEQKSLYYVGHSMGSTMFYVLMSMKPEYNAKIRHMVALAPVAFLRNTKSLFAVATKFVPKGVSSKILKGNRSITVIMRLKAHTVFSHTNAVIGTIAVLMCCVTLHPACESSQGVQVN